TAGATTRFFSVPINIEEDVTTYGFGIGLDYRFYKSYTFSTNLSSDVLKDVPEGYISFFNAPKYRFNASVSNAGIGKEKRVGFMVSYKWQDAFYYEGDFANGDISAIHTLDAQVSYRLPKIKSVVKLGGNNIL